MQTISHLADKVLGQKPVSTGTTQPNVDKEHPMHALVYNGTKSIAYVQVPRPLLTEENDALIRVTGTTICGSDLHLYAGEMPDMHKGDILGHEFMGIIEQVGPGVKKLNVGQRVVVSFDIACGSCDYCKREEYTSCDTTNPSKLMEKSYGHRTAGLFGYSHLTGGYPGGQAEYARVPFADINCLVIPDSVRDEHALYLSDILCTSLHACDCGEVKQGDVVAIWGLGPIGLMTAWWAKYRGASRVIGIECVKERLEIAQKTPLAIETIDFSQKNVLETLESIVPGGVDVAIECAGFRYSKAAGHVIQRALKLETDTPEIIVECVTALRKFGRLSIISDYTGFANGFPIGIIMEKHIKINGGQSPTQKYWKYVLGLLESGELDPSFVVTHKLPLSDGPDAYKKFFFKEDGMVKVFMWP